MQLLRNLIVAEIKALLFFGFLPFGVALGIFMTIWYVLDMPPQSEDHEEYIKRINWSLTLIASCIIKPFKTALNGICEFIADAFIIPRQQTSTTRRRE